MTTFINPKKVSKRCRLKQEHDDLIKSIESMQIVDIGTPTEPHQVSIPLDDKVIKVLMCGMADVKSVEDIPKDMYETYSKQAVNIYINQVVSSIHNKYK